MCSCGWAAAYHAVLSTVGDFFPGTSETVAKRKCIHYQIGEDFMLVTPYLVQQPRENKLGRQVIALIIIM